MSENAIRAELSGVPKAVLQTVFGKAVGRRIWQQNRLSNAPAPATGVVHSEVVTRMIDYLARRAEEALQQQGRKATSVGLRVTCTDGISRTERLPLPRPTSSAQELAAAGVRLLAKGRAHGAAVVVVNLTLSSVPAERLVELGPAFCEGMTAVAAHT